MRCGRRVRWDGAGWCGGVGCAADEVPNLHLGEAWADHGAFFYAPAATTHTGPRAKAAQPAGMRAHATVRRSGEGDFEGACEGACELLKHRLRGGARGGAGAGVLEGGLDASGLRRTLSVGPYTLRSRTERALPRRCAPISLPICSMLDSPPHTLFSGCERSQSEAQQGGTPRREHASVLSIPEAAGGGGGRASMGLLLHSTEPLMGYQEASDQV